MEKYENETIAAIATALSDSGIGIVRISGENAIYIIDNIFRSAAGRRILTKVQSHTIHYGYIVDSDENVIDEVMVAVMKAPRSYTTEDTVEINCHGGVLVMQKVLEAVLHAGARLAQPGEFTKRAFLNGRIDLSRAEAVIMDINVKEGTNTASPGPMPQAISTRERASVPLAQVMQCLRPA